MPTERVLGDFIGLWELERDITPATGAPARFEGQATWRAVPGGAAYHETGVLHLDGAAPMMAQRRYAWRDDLSVWFTDGRPFHTVPPLGGQATHFCDPDTYVSTYDFAEWPVFWVRHDVTGPKKDYAMITRYTRSARG